MIGAQFVEALRGLSLPWSMLLTLALFFVPNLRPDRSMMIAVGSMVTKRGKAADRGARSTCCSRCRFSSSSYSSRHLTVRWRRS